MKKSGREEARVGVGGRFLSKGKWRGEKIELGDMTTVKYALCIEII